MEFKRKDLLALLEALGGWHKQSLQTALQGDNDDQLAAIVCAKLALVPDVSVLEDELLKPLPLEWRARLMARRVELDTATRAARSTEAAIAAGTVKVPRGNLVVNVPVQVGISDFYSSRGRLCKARTDAEGCVVLDLFRDEFMVLLGDRNTGLHWHNANPEVLRQLGGWGNA